MNFDNILNTLNIGVIILDKNMHIRYWNNWMSVHSGIKQDSIIGSDILNLFPNLNTPAFLRNFKSSLKFGNINYISRKMHPYLFPIKTYSSFQSQFEFMQQSCSICPVRGENESITHICITVQDVTQLAIYEKKLIEMNLRDSLTGAYNRRFLSTKLEDELEKHNRCCRSMSLMMIDIDHFKNVNDMYGHQTGDLVLKSIADEISSMVRNNDFLVRFGGEEFCCILPETNLDSATLLAERIRKIIEKKEHSFNVTDPIRITVSIGVYECKDNKDSADSMLKKADEALYLAKETGRNRVIALR
ncbi:MAG: diguanylate cyclase [Pseudomonadota bacterium]